jgi:uncharacterized protein YgbK (DUF1537 family)
LNRAYKGWDMKNIVVIADDFTGAGDSGVHFARGGFRTALLLDSHAISQMSASHDVVAVSSESRFMRPENASEAVYDLTLRCRQAGGEFFYKKTDSALRGNVGAETAAVLRVLNRRAALVCPALPEAGRTCVNGTLLIDGRPVHATGLGKDPFTPVKSSSVAECLADQTDLRVGFISLEVIAAGREALHGRVRKLLRAGCRLLAADAATNADLAELGALLRAADDPASDLTPLLPVGSAGLAKALAGPERTASARPRGRLLAVVGSLSAEAWAQADFACGRNAFTALSLDVRAGLSDPDAECARLVRAGNLTGDAHVLVRGLTPPEEQALGTEEGIQVAGLYGRAVRALCRALPFETVFATGGSTAVAAAGALGLKSLALVDELMPGVVLSSCAGEDTGVRWFISKAGSFGGREALAAIAASTVCGQKKG